jgi:hypothetical protein
LSAITATPAATGGRMRALDLNQPNAVCGPPSIWHARCLVTPEPRPAGEMGVRMTYLRQRVSEMNHAERAWKRVH